MHCEPLEPGSGTPLMTLERWGIGVLEGDPRMVWSGRQRLTLQSARGRIELVQNR
jgi:hypothetical protein